MREIVFRGKRIDNGKWVEGLLFKYNGKYCIQLEGIARDDYGLYPRCNAEAIPETVGQYTGLTDLIGTKIFEGDIVKATISKIGGGYVSAIVTVALDDYELMYDIERSDILEVIGNIHDNPELLKGGVQE